MSGRGYCPEDVPDTLLYIEGEAVPEPRKTGNRSVLYANEWLTVARLTEVS